MKTTIITLSLALLGSAWATPKTPRSDITARDVEVMRREDGTLFLLPRLESLGNMKRQGCLECPCSGWDPSSCCCPSGKNCCNHCDSCK
ncbi:hypothetical protein B0T25DRAFT_329118 [Lasiosphaeria hispida]|uniref:Conotoxin n=1 Tax=Lasiosphaeria hispida TaxID=260671 RepID=A0AAJ0HAH1_9PEZI|nr:hypothetical protein B0T25DRAFT_329118 [Lasiosphaeria hispida]